jgi:hypothetical protein
MYEVTQLWSYFTKSYRMLVGKLEGKRPLGRSRLRWEYNVKIDLGQMG